ncbi:phosphoprotein associated with glycosphingolipid-enriched microdomains 1 [Antennarius striatus]|uniref:phosphoprotein associated with glycosphingolipid-enriched microdomains 1 n=1 Tax=Antennarius striatus TaxID=241820 RepID=UPI0035B04142
MAPLLSGVWWGPEMGVMESRAAAAAEVGARLGSGQLVLAVTLSALTALLLVSVLLLLCAGCQGQKKSADGHPAGDYENLMIEASEKDSVSQSAESPVTDAAVSSSHNGPVTSGTILTDTQDTSPQPSEEMLSIQSELRSSKCPQDRELPSIPPNNALMGDGPPASGDSTYEVVKEMAVTSRDVSAEDSLYETVKELKERPIQLGLPNGTLQPSPDEPPHHPALANGHLSPRTPERKPLSAKVEYASIDLRKKSRHSAEMQAKRRSESVPAPPSRPPEEPEEELPPPVPEKLLDENDNRPVVMNGLHNGELHSPLSPEAEFHNRVLSDNESAVYSTVNKKRCTNVANEDDKEHDYSSIAEIKGLVSTSSSSDLYASVKDIYAHPDEPRPGEDPASDPGYETIRIPKTSSSDDDCGVGMGAEEGADASRPEPDYESVGELGLSRETSRL